MTNSNQDFIKHSFLCGLRGFHVYKEIWKPIVGELLRFSHEQNNTYDRYAMAANKRLPWSPGQFDCRPVAQRDF